MINRRHHVTEFHPTQYRDGVIPCNSGRLPVPGLAGGWRPCWAGLGWAGLGSASLHFICSTTQKHSLNIRVGIGILSCLVKTWKLNGTNELASLKCKTTIKEIKNAVIPRSDSRPSVQIHSDTIISG